MRGRYELGAVIGQGGVAVVHRAKDTLTGKLVALKHLQPSEDAGVRERSVELFEREFHTLRQLAHPNVVEAYDYGVDEVGPYYTMELLDGGDLFCHRAIDEPSLFGCATSPPCSRETVLVPGSSGCDRPFCSSVPRD
jgi:serine/threonine protein kinase